MFGIAATHVRCPRCGTTTQIPEDAAADTTCRNCGNAGELVAIVPCPSEGLTSACTAAEHELGQHIIPVD